MIALCYCLGCNKKIQWSQEEMQSGTALNYTLNIDHFLPSCEKCHHSEKCSYQIHFCSYDCLEKTVIEGNLKHHIDSKVWSLKQFKEKEYEKDVQFWTELFNDCRPYAWNWTTPWLNNRFTNGELMDDHNPTFSAWHPEEKRGIRILQEQTQGIAWWIDNFAEGDQEEVRELVIYASQKDAGIVKGLITDWIQLRVVTKYFTRYQINAPCKTT